MYTRCFVDVKRIKGDGQAELESNVEAKLEKRVVKHESNNFADFAPHVFDQNAMTAYLVGKLISHL